MESKSNCVVCGRELVYSRKHEKRTCVYCGETEESNAECGAGHFVCDCCHRLSANDLIERTCIRSHSTNPMELASVLMRNPAVKMHGPEHHFMIPAVLLAAYHNAKGSGDRKDPQIKEARKRGYMPPEGVPAEIKHA